ncbi:hypothetical protein B0H10DRAFT_2020005 [Mycena sp. CBHHK59/15]|nr:hypothetical protein B0H10DRAFT_2020005 [Mycena sp. CBHHK59/15]
MPGLCAELLVLPIQPLFTNISVTINWCRLIGVHFVSSFTFTDVLCRATQQHLLFYILTCVAMVPE